MLTCCNTAGTNNGVCESCINFRLFEMTLPNGGIIGEWRCTTNRCDNGSEFKLRTPESEIEAQENHDHW